MASCTNCGKDLFEGDWVSKSGLCRPCAEAKHDGATGVWLRKYWWVALLVGLFIIGSAIRALNPSPQKSEWEQIIDGAQYVGYIKETENVVFVMFTDEELYIRDSIKEKISTDLYLEQCDNVSGINIVTVVLADINTEKVYSGFCYIFDEDTIIDIDSDLALAGIGLATQGE